HVNGSDHDRAHHRRLRCSDEPRCSSRDSPARPRRRSGHRQVTMTVLPLLQHSQPRATPIDVVRGLREVDPTADMYYLGWKKWVLVSVRPNDEHRRAALRMILGSPATGTQPARPGLRTLLWLWETNAKYRANPGAFRQLMQKYE